ncbi:MAG: 30S ribosomal protein S12 methylthiotransferase RimO [Treponema sp.]|nr:30S ribosomal protein S12 methylthiotransferase RimO [Treponema sp.]
MTKQYFYIDQHGCAKNQTDGEIIAGFLQDEGFVFTKNPAEADFIFINSCGFIESAKKESIDSIYAVKAAYPNAKIILTGCLAQRYAQMLSESMPELSGVFGNGDLSKIVDFMKTFSSESNKGCLLRTYEQTGVSTGNRPYLYNFKGSAFVKVTEGCSNHCSFCAIPLIRGELRSRPWQDIVEEVKTLVDAGVYEINLIGQDLAAYGTGLEPVDLALKKEADGLQLSPLGLLLTKLHEIKINENKDDDFLIRTLYIHPDHFTPDILEIMKSDERFAHYFDIPFQSGDDEIIHKMNRKGSFEQYVQLVNNIRAVLPDCAIRTTFLTGFPGETDKSAENTRNFLKTIQPTWSGCFPYSREEDTPAYNLKNRVPGRVAKKRAAMLEEIQLEITMKKLESYVGQNLKVIIEEIIENNSEENPTEGLAIGRAWFQAPEVDGCVVIRYDLDDAKQVEAVKAGNVVSAKILASTGVDLDARFVSLQKKCKETDKLQFVL